MRKQKVLLFHLHLYKFTPLTLHKSEVKPQSSSFLQIASVSSSSSCDSQWHQEEIPVDGFSQGNMKRIVYES